MSRVKRWSEAGVAALRKNWFIFFAVLVYAFFTLYYMGPSVTQCSTTTYGFGDNTAGPIWRSSLPENQGLLGAYTSMTNAPYGDNLYSPVGYSLILQPVLISSLMGVAGPICGYNLVNIIGFLASALTMMGLVLFLTKNRWIALFAGYAVSFSPYYQMKVGGHPSYGYQAIFIGLIWLFLRLMKYQRKRDAGYLALLFAVAVYFDPYFSLFAGLTMLALGGGWLLTARRLFTSAFWRQRLKKDDLVRRQLRSILLTIGAIVVFLAPLVMIMLSSSEQINANVAASRGNVIAEAKACSNYPQEYLTPFILHPVFEKVFGADRYHHLVEVVRGGLTCGIGEDSIGLSLVLVAFASCLAIVLMWERLNRRTTNLTKWLFVSPKLVVAGVVFLGVLGFLIALPPVRFHGIPTLSYELLSVTSTWRTLSRSYMLVNIALVMFVALGLVYIKNQFPKSTKLLVGAFVVMWVGVFVEYQAFKPFSGNKLSTFSYKSDVPAVYTWLKDQPRIKVIAEYPLERGGGESDALSYYLTMQVVHEKKLFNSALSYSAQEQFKDGLKNLSDPQTIPALRAMGVDAIVVHGVPSAAVAALPGAEELFTAPQARFNLLSHTPTVKNDTTTVIDITHVVSAQRIIDLGNGFARNTQIIRSALDWGYEAVDGSELKALSLNGSRYSASTTSSMKACFTAAMSVPEENTELFAKVGQTKVSLGPIRGDTKQRYAVEFTGSTKLYVINGHNFRVWGLGCNENE